MKIFTLILVLVILISLFVVMPAFAGEGPDHPGKACGSYDVIFAWGLKKGIHNQVDKFGVGHQRGRFYGPGIGRNICD
jgi:hypothetical protein